MAELTYTSQRTSFMSYVALERDIETPVRLQSQGLNKRPNNALRARTKIPRFESKNIGSFKK